MKQPTRFPTIDDVWLFVAAALIGLRPLLTPIPPHDFWWHMATGRLIVQTGSIPTVDGFSYTRAGEPFFNQGWLSQVLMYGLHQLGGVPLLLLVQAAVLVLAYWLILQICVRRSGNVQLSVGLLLLTTMPLSFDNWNVRPQSYAFPIFAAFLAILTDYRLTGRNRLPLLPLLMVLWVNLHGSFVLGGGLVAITLVGEWLKRLVPGRQGTTAAPQPPLRPLLLWGAVAAVALLLNPRGVAVLGYVRNLLGTSSVTSLVTEWAAPTTRDTGGVIFFLFLILTIVILAYARRPPDLTDMLLAGAFLWLSLGAVRNIVWFGMVATPLLVVQARAIWAERDVAPLPPRRPAKQGLPALNWALIGLMALLLLLGLPWVKPVLDLPPELGALLAPDTPVAAVACMQQQPTRPTRLFHAMGYGSYLIWADPQQKVFIDPRIELYPFEQWRDYIAIGAGGAESKALIERYRFDALLINAKEQDGLLQSLRTDPRWKIVCADEQSTYMVQTN